ncbi:MAG: DEAD/DEAH box helicase [Chromatiales bacterium]|jgi:DEAD/DEAH box helicase domain-containing protein|nr:DEAD/DEAH box helicase [Chromatiales bacterium]
MENKMVTASPDPVAAALCEIERFGAGRITGKLHVPERPGKLVDLPRDLDPALAAALGSRGVHQLYSHQREAWDTVSAGKDVVIVTPTASGKSLCYNLPVIDAVRNRGAKALYLFPTKALSQDQVAELLELNKAADLGVRVFTYDGDTPGDARKAIRSHGDIVVSNPDMVHQGILPHHTRWARFFEALRYIVIDEAHIYRGCFGAHVANVIRRLLRIASFYGSNPQFVLCSATIGNPGEHAQTLTGREVVALTESGAPQGPRDVLLWNPPVVNPELGMRASARSQTAALAKASVGKGARTIIFARSRTMVEVLTKYLKDAFDNDKRRPARVKAYRGGYLPTERRGTEQALRAGDIDCVVATSALELGVDIGALDVCILNGYPGTIAGTWQRLGRAGRRQRRALGILVATSDPLDQFVVRHPEFFMGATPEHARVAPNQELILLEHIRCAAFELPFANGEMFGSVAPDDYLAYLQEEGLVHLEGERWHWMAESYPANSVSLRSVANGNFVVIDITDGQRNVIAEVDYSGAPMTLYEGAIYLIQARPWQVEKLDWQGRKAFVTQTRADYFTEAIDYTRLKILERFAVDESPAVECAHGEVHVVRRVSGYKKIRYYTHENIGYGDVDLPDCEMHTTGLWWRLSPTVLESVFASRSTALDGFHGAAYALHHIAALVAMSEPQDIGRAVGTGDGGWFNTQADAHRRRSGGDSTAQEIGDQFEPTIFLYDNFPGGMGLSAPLHKRHSTLVARAAELVQSCDCQDGCPACVGPVLSSEEGRELSPKQAALRVLGELEQIAVLTPLTPQSPATNGRFAA